MPLGSQQGCLCPAQTSPSSLLKRRQTFFENEDTDRRSTIGHRHVLPQPVIAIDEGLQLGKTLVAVRAARRRPAKHARDDGVHEYRRPTLREVCQIAAPEYA